MDRKLGITIHIITLIVSAITVQAARQDTISIVAVGDIMPGSSFPYNNMLPKRDGALLFSQVTPYLSSGNVCVGNLEGVFYDGKAPARGCGTDTLRCYRFKIPMRYIVHVKRAGFNTLSIANNHSRDFGVGARDTMIIGLRKSGIAFAGSLEHPSCTFTRDGVKYGFCAFSVNKETPLVYDIEGAKETVARLKSECDIVIVSMHIGAEGTKYDRVTRKQEVYMEEERGNPYEFAHSVVDAGADLVVGHGPHVVRGIELYKNKLIAYSLGNFCTAGRFNIKGTAGYAPMLKARYTEMGEFVDAEIISAIQLNKEGPVLDERNRAASQMIYLSQLDFPESPLKFTPIEKGYRIERK